MADPGVLKPVGVHSFPVRHVEGDHAIIEQLLKRTNLGWVGGGGYKQLNEVINDILILAF